MREKIILNDSKGSQLVGILEAKSDSKKSPVIIVCHGFTSNKDKSAKIVSDALTEAGLATFRFDFFGHGENDGDFADITISKAVDDIFSAIKLLKGRGYAKIGLLGTSFGGQSALSAAAKTNDLFVLIARAPVSNYVEINNARYDYDQWRKNGFTIHTTSRGEEKKLNYSFAEDAENQIVWNFADKIKIPTLIVHGTGDTTVPIEQSRKTAKLIPNCTLIEFEGADHKFSDPELFKQSTETIVDFALKYSA